MSNLFSIFDPQAFLFLPINWSSSFLILLLVPNIFWVVNNQTFTVLTIARKFIYSEFAAITGPALTPGGTFLCVRIFIFIALNNFSGLFPYIFTSSSHLTFTVTLALPLWLGHRVIAWFKTTDLILAHLVPQGTPYVLMPFIVLIETIRSLIRPLTLSVRLAANMVAGHLLLTLLSSQAPSVSAIVLLGLLMGLTILGLLESAVAVIQAYVFSVLRTLYVNEVTSTKLTI